VNEFPSWLEWLPDGMESWETLVAIATILVALATDGLASATFVLARQTKNDVGASTRTAAVAERSFATSIRPILVNFVESGEPRVRKHGQHDRLEVSVPLRNVGGGLALLLGPSIEVASTGYTGTAGGGMPPGGLRRKGWPAASEDGCSQLVRRGNR
jgi:hypothetical protein